MQIIDKNNIPNILELEIEKLSNLGYGIAKYNGYVIFVENSCPGDIVRVELTKKNKNYANAKILDIISPSKDRVEPFCKLSKVCGSCHLQFINYDAQLKFKQDIVKDIMSSIYGKPVEVREAIPSPQIKEYRHKIQYPIAQTKNSQRILAGYYKTGTHDLINIKHCPIQPECCDEIIEFIRQEAHNIGINAYEESTGNGCLRHVVLRSSLYNNKTLVVLVINSDKVPQKIKLLAKQIYTKLENITGVCVNLNNKKTNIIFGEITQLAEGSGYVEEELCDKIFKVSAKTFFQVNPGSANNIFRYIKNYISANFKTPAILDAYAGITAFGIVLSDIASKVISIEDEIDSVSLAKDIIKENKINNIELHCGDAGQFFANEALLGRQFHITILDPPRKGCSLNSLDYALKLTKDKIIYVSCNPATLARDLKYLSEHGAEVEFIQPFDMFPHTYHIENVAIIDLKNVQMPEPKLPF